MFSGGFPGFFGGFGGHSSHDDDAMSEEKRDNDTQKLYDILGLPKTAQADDIRRQYKKLAIKLHPDKGGDPEKFKELCEAYEILSNPEKREIYDKYGKDGLKDGGAGSGGHPFDIFDNIFGGGRGQQKSKGPKKGKPQLIPVKVTLEDVYQGKMVKIPHSRKKLCEVCDGQGGKNVNTCKGCKGRGMVEKMIQLGPGMYQHSQQPCSDCRGEGKCIDEKDKCKTCKGQKVVEQKKTLEVAVEPGTPHDHDIILTGESDEYPGIIAGDIYARVQIEEHKVFSRKGADLYLDKQITLLEALTGSVFEIKHLDGKKIKITTLPGDVISHNQIKTIKGKGMPFHKDKMSYGNLFIKFSVQFPKTGELTENQINSLKQTLPGPKIQQVQKGEAVEYLEDFYESDQNPNAEGGKKKHDDEDEEEYGRQGGQRVQCQQQ